MPTRVLSIVREPATAALVERTLAGNVDQLLTVEDGVAALTLLSTQTFQIVVSDWFVPRQDGLAITRQLRKSESKVRIVLLSDVENDSARRYAFECGVDAFLPKPFDPGALLSAAGVIANGEPTTPVTPASETPTSNRPTVGQTSTWKSLDRMICDAVRSFSSLDVRLGAQVRLGPTDCCATLRAAEAKLGLEIGIAVLASQASLTALTSHLLGGEEAPKEMLDDILRELVNVAGGVLKTSLTLDGMACTIGLPKSGSADMFGPFAELYGTTRRFGMAAPGVEMGFAIGFRSTAPVELSIRRLREDMVLVSDLKTPQGAMLVPAGTRLTASMAERLSGHGLKGRVHVTTVEG